MVKLCLLCAFESIITLAILKIFNLKNNKNNNTISYKLLAAYISQENKKRNLHSINRKFKPKSSIFAENSQIQFIKQKTNKTKYKILSRSYLSFKTEKLIQKNQTYAEKINNNFSEEISKLSIVIDKIINNKKSTFRSKNNECIIETVARSFSNATLTEERFDMFSCFKTLSTKVKIYKKEAEILSCLVIKNLIELYVVLQEEIFKIKKQVIKAKHIKRLSPNAKPTTIYGTFLLNKSASKLLLKSKQNVIDATNLVISELDSLCYKQKIIYRYIKFFEKTLWDKQGFFL